MFIYSIDLDFLSQRKCGNESAAGSYMSYSIQDLRRVSAGFLLKSKQKQNWLRQTWLVSEWQSIFHNMIYTWCTYHNFLDTTS